MGKITFPIDDRFKAIVEHAASHEPDLFYGEKIPKSIYLVKDEGIYLMSAGKPCQPDPDKPGSNLVLYALEADPTKRDRMEVWDIARHLVGGDDFAEPLGVETFQRAIANGHKEVTINVTSTNLEIITQ